MGRYEVVEIFAGLLLTLTAAVVGVWRMSGRDRPIHGPRDDGTLGIPHLQHWSDGYRKPRFERIHRFSPRVEVSRMLALSLLLIFLAAGSIITYTIVVESSGDNRLSESEAFADIVTLHAEANQASDTVASYQLLTEARTQISSLTAGLPDQKLDQRILEERESIAVDLERLTSMTTLDNVQAVGSVPDLPNDASAQLFSGGGKIYLVAGALYEVNAADSTLVKLLEPGDVVEGQEVGRLQGGTWRSDGPLVMDANATYTLDTERGDWLRDPMGVPAKGDPGRARAMDVYDFNLYTLDTEQGRILKYVAGDYEAEPEDWTAGLAADALRQAVDLEIDGNIYVLLRDGRIISFYLSALDEQWQPGIVPPIDSANTLVHHPGSDYFYITNTADGRIIRIDSSGELVQQFQTPPDTPSLANISDLVIDEETNIAYAIVSGDTLFTIRLPGRGPDTSARLG